MQTSECEGAKKVGERKRFIRTNYAIWNSPYSHDELRGNPFQSVQRFESKPFANLQHFEWILVMFLANLASSQIGKSGGEKEGE